MLNSIFSSAEAVSSVTTAEFLEATLASVVLGLVIMLFYSYKNTSSKNFLVTLVLMPVIVQAVIMVVNGNVGTGVAVMGAFSLVRFRSVPGNARDICAIFLSMAAGLATGTGYIGIAAVIVGVVCVINLIFTAIGFGDEEKEMKELVITVPETLDYTGAFDEVLGDYLSNYELTEVKSTNMGSLFKLKYNIVMKDPSMEKAMLDSLRCRNGNLDIICRKADTRKKEQL